MKFTYTCKGTCSRMIDIEVEDGIVKHIEYIGGCTGNTQGVARLAEGRSVDEVIALTEGIQCRNGTSCPDQLAKALRQIKENA